MSSAVDKQPLVSCLCVTENRQAFMPWLLWCFDRQTWTQRELVVIDSSDEPWKFSNRGDIRVISVAPGTGVATKRNIALREARGEILSWLDDDDWQHPNKLEILVDALQEGSVYAGSKSAWFVDLFTHQCSRYQGLNGQIIFNSGGFLRSAVQSIRFPENARKASDTKWLQSLKARHCRSPKIITNELLFFWLCHSQNLSNPAGKNRSTHSIDKLKRLIGPDAWLDTDEHFDVLSDRLNEQDQIKIAEDQCVKKNVKLQSNNVKSIQNNQYGSMDTTISNPKISVCLVSWKRPENLQIIINKLNTYGFIDEIIVWNNSPAITLSLEGKNVKIINSPDNMICYGRFLCAKQAKNEIIYVQDDDALVNNIQELYENFLRHPSCITHALYGLHFQIRKRYYYGKSHVALLGWGAFFKKSWVDVFDEYIQTYGRDKLMLREADKIFSMLLRKHHQTIQAKAYMLKDFAVAGIALYCEKDHERLKSLAVKRCLELIRKKDTVCYPVSWNVVITCHNYGKYLSKAIDSVLQNDADYVITIVDDASNDNTGELCKSYTKQYDQIDAIHLKQRVGVGAARNLGIATTQSTFVVLLDADDNISSNFLYEAEKLLRSGYDVANPDAILFGAKNARWVVPETVDYQMLRKRNYVHCCAAFRRSYWEQVRGIDESMKNWQDYDFWIRIAREGARIKKLHGDHFFYRKHGQSVSSISAAHRAKLMADIRVRYALRGGAPS